MPPLPTLAAGGIMAALVLYALTGGADFGGGVWTLFARGPRARAQRELVVRAIGPIWETNHIWLIVAVVVLFTAFPRAFAVVSTALFVPLTLALVGIVFRGAAFAFHSHALHGGRPGGRWEAVFAASSLLTPLLLGVAAGAISAGELRVRGVPALAPPPLWLSPFPLAAGLFTVALCCYLAAVYLVLETRDEELREDFRGRAIWSARAVIALGALVPVAAARWAPAFQESLLESRWSASVLLMAATGALGSYLSLHFRSYWLARACAVGLVSFVAAGWGLAQYPYLVRPDVTVASSASPETLRLLLLALAGGAVILFPSIGVLFALFKKDAFWGDRRGRGRAPGAAGPPSRPPDTQP